jgi:hypothetical protein
LGVKIVAPQSAVLPRCFSRVSSARGEHEKLLRAIQRLRGDVYREYAPIAATLTPDGRHCQSIDAESWHIVLQDANNEIVGCARYRPILGGFSQLGARHSALAKNQQYRHLLRKTIEEQIAIAKSRNIQYGEAGAWALRPEIRCSTAALNIVLTTYALATRLGGGIGITTATTRHNSASILRRLGGSNFVGLPAYYDPAYGTTIEMIQFDENDLSQQYRNKLRKIMLELEDVEVVCPSDYKEYETLPFNLAVPLHSGSLSAQYAIQ